MNYWGTQWCQPAAQAAVFCFLAGVPFAPSRVGETSLDGMCYLVSLCHSIVSTARWEAHLLQERVELGRLSDLEITGLDGIVVDPENHVDRVHRLGPDIGKLLDLGGSVLDLEVSAVFQP